MFNINRKPNKRTAAQSNNHALHRINAEIEKLDYSGTIKKKRHPMQRYCPYGTTYNANNGWCEVNSAVPGQDTVLMMIGQDGQYYDMAVAENFDKDFFVGAPISVPVSQIQNPINARPNPSKYGVVPGFNLPQAAAPVAAPITGKLPTYPSETIPVKRMAEENELADADQFDITITKTIIGAGVLGNLPFMLFSPVFFASNYTDVIKNLPAGATLTISTAANGDIIFNYTLGIDSTLLTISSATTPYASILRALMADRFNIVKTRESISDATILSQVNLPLEVSNGSLFGGQSFNNLSAVATKGPDQFQAGIIDFNAVYPLDKYRAVQGLISGTAPTGFTVTFSFWAKHVRKF